MFGDNPNDADLKASWERFCDQLKAAGDSVFRDGAPSGDIDRAEGFRQLARNISLGLQFKLDNANPERPELQRYFDPTRKQGGDNSDALYVGAPIDGEHSYRISGHRGSARFFAITVLEDGATPWGGAVVGSLIDEQIEIDPDGQFEVVLSPQPHAGNWIRTTPGSWRVTVRQFFADWEHEQAMTARIDCVDALSPDIALTPLQLQRGLVASAEWVASSTHYWAEMLDKWRVQANRFVSYRQLDGNAIDATPGGEPLICYWRLPEDEVLIIRVQPPQADYWSVEFGNGWWETMDYRYRLCSTNCHQAVLEDGGELILIVSHDDPGLPNWLDPSGHSEGYVTVRWIGAQTYPVPLCEQIKVSELARYLPSSVRTIRPGERAEQLASRRRGISKRFGS